MSVCGCGCVCVGVCVCVYVVLIYRKKSNARPIPSPNLLLSSLFAFEIMNISCIHYFHVKFIPDFYMRKLYFFMSVLHVALFSLCGNILNNNPCVV